MDKLSHSSQLHGRGGLGLGSYQTELQVKAAHARGLAQPGAGTFQGSLIMSHNALHGALWYKLNRQDL